MWAQLSHPAPMIEAFFNFIAKAIAAFLGLVFVILTAVVLQVRSSDTVLLDPLTYQLALAETNTYLKLPELVAAEAQHRRGDYAEAAAAGDLGAILVTSLEDQDWRNLTTLLLPAAEVQRLSEDAIQQGFDWLEMRQDTVVLDLSNLKRNAAGKNGTKAVEILAGALPECGEPGCPSSTQVAAEFDPKAVTADLPDNLPLIDGPRDPDERVEVARLRAMSGFAPLALGLLLAVVALFGARSRAGWLRWLGVPLLLAGLLAIGLGLGAPRAQDLVWAQYLIEVEDAFSPAVVAQLRAVVGSVTAEFVRHLQFEGGLVALVGLALTLISFFVPEPRLRAA